jgi:hypothetical protein
LRRVEVKKEEEVGKIKEVLVMVLRTTFVFAKGKPEMAGKAR